MCMCKWLCLIIATPDNWSHDLIERNVLPTQCLHVFILGCVCVCVCVRVFEFAAALQSALTRGVVGLKEITQEMSVFPSIPLLSIALFPPSLFLPSSYPPYHFKVRSLIHFQPLSTPTGCHPTLPVSLAPSTRGIFLLTRMELHWASFSESSSLVLDRVSPSHGTSVELCTHSSRLSLRWLQTLTKLISVMSSLPC